MKRISMLFLLLTVIGVLGLTTDKAMAQFTDEIFLCTDGSSPDACRQSALDPDPNTGVVNWDRASYGSNLCAGVGITPQENRCTIMIAAYPSRNCVDPSLIEAPGAAEAGTDLFIFCADITGLPSGAYSGKAINSSCFEGQSPCLDFNLN